MCGLGPLLRPGGPWPVTWGPDSSCGGLIRLAGPWHVLRDPDSFCGALISPAAPWFVLRAWSVFGALIRPTGPDLSCGALIRLVGPSRGARVRSVEPWFFLRGPIRPAEPWNLIKNRPQLGAQAGPGGPASVWGAKDMLVPGDWPLRGMAGMPPPPPPWDHHYHGVHFQTPVPVHIWIYLPKTT